MNREENGLSKAPVQPNMIWWSIKILVHRCVGNPFKYSQYNFD